MLQVCDAYAQGDDCTKNCECPTATNRCLPDGKCIALVTTLAPQVNAEAPPFPDRQVRQGNSNCVVVRM